MPAGCAAQCAESYRTLPGLGVHRLVPPSIHSLGERMRTFIPIAAVLSLPETLAGDGAYFSFWSDDAETPFRITLPDTTNRRVR